MEEELRLSKLMSQRGLCSRREADKLIEAGQVLVDGEPVTQLGLKVLPSVKIELSAQASKEQAERLTIMINKPVGYVSGQAEDDYIPAIRLVAQDNRSELDRSKIRVDYTKLQGLAPAGRLDIDSQGLLVLTQDGRIAKMLIGENSDIEKEYLVRVRGAISEAQINQLSFGLELDGKPLKRAKVRQLNEQQLQIILREGKKRQIRRMCDAVGLHVTGLKRVRVGELRLGKLEEGKWRVVKTEEFRHRPRSRGSAKKPNRSKTFSKSRHSRK